MANRILEGLWDCPYCKTKGIGGLTKHCPCCGHPQDDDTQFYMGTQKKYLDEELAKQYGQGADWVCPYCGSLNRTRFKFCSNCGAPKDESTKDYFTPDTAAEAKVKQTTPIRTAAPTPQPKRKPILPIILLALVAVLVFTFMPRNFNGKVIDKNWQRTIDVEDWRTVQESDWVIPDGGRMTNQHREIHHYDTVLDHYETKTRRVSEQVYDGEDVHTSYSNNGDGTFTETTYTTPRYRTEYRTETYQDPVYVQVPRYATKYDYDIERWIYNRTELSEGKDDTPYWPDVTLAENERQGDSRERYTLTMNNGKDKDYTISVDQALWEKFSMNENVRLTVVAGSVTKINDTTIK